MSAGLHSPQGRSMSSSVPNSKPRPWGESATGSDLQYNLEITLEDAFQGKATTLRVAVLDASGVRRKKTLSLNIPAGVEDGTRLKLAGEGEYGPGGARPGDLYVLLSIAQHPFFVRHGADIYIRAPIPMLTAILGGTLEIPTFNGRARLTVPPGLQSGHQLRLKGQGMTVPGSAQRGDLYAEMIVETPVNLTSRQHALLREALEDGETGKTSPESEDFAARVRKLWE